MANVADEVFDSLLDYVDTNGNAIYICSADPSTYTEASSTYALGSKSSITISTPVDRTGGGREITVSGFNNGLTTGTGTATHWALVNTSGSAFLLSGSLGTSRAVTPSTSFGMSTFAVGLPDPT